MSSNATTNETSSITSLPSTSKAQTAEEVIAANVKLLIEQLDGGDLPLDDVIRSASKPYLDYRTYG